MSNKRTIKKELEGLKKLNYTKKLKLRAKPLKSGGFSLFLDYWNGNNRQYDFLRIYLKGTVADYQEDKDKLKLAASLRDKKEFELYRKGTDFDIRSQQSEMDFIDYFRKIADKKNNVVWENTYKHLVRFTNNKPIKIKHLDYTFFNNLKEYLLKSVSNNSANAYLIKIKAALNIAVDSNIIQSNPAKKVKIKKTETERVFLTFEELKKLRSTEIYNEEVKRAFLFSCFTGLRLSDIEALTFNQIIDGYLQFRQQKTKGYERIKINKTALEILNYQKKIRHSDKVFELPTRTNINIHLKKWVKTAGIDKKITYHVSRHTFATLNITFGNDLFTVSKLLGHKDLKTTQIYAKLIDKKKDEAVNRLPEL